MIFVVNEEQVTIPDTVSPYEVEIEAQEQWIIELFVAIKTTAKSPQKIWEYVFGVIFENKELTEYHKYYICMGFAALITSSLLSEDYARMIEESLPEIIKKHAYTVMPTLALLEGKVNE
jgi:hypothetical protein